MSDLEKLFVLQIMLIPGLLLYSISDVKKLRKELESLKTDISTKLAALETWRVEHAGNCTEKHSQHRKNIDELWSKVRDRGVDR